MNFLIENWYLIIALAVFVAFVIYCIIKHRANVITWLGYAVSMAEKELGSGTGQLKLRQVYDAFIQKFPKTAMFVSFNTFSKWVDISLKWFSNQLETNRNVLNYITK